MSKKKPVITERRKFFTDAAHTAGLGVLGGLVWAGYADKAVSSPLTLRPPAALSEKDFLRTCIKCTLCAEACLNRPSNIDRETGEPRPATLKIAKADSGVTIGTPYFKPVNHRPLTYFEKLSGKYGDTVHMVDDGVPCYMCDDIPCVPVCPTGALDEALVTNGKGELDFRQMDMGLAVVDQNSCIAYWGIQCDACYRACPLLDEAIKLEYGRNDRTGKHAFLKPIVDMDICTGCGLCEKACVTEKPAIFVHPREVALGRPGSHYVKGWDKKDQERVKDAKAIHTINTRSEKKPVDYLNEGVSYD